VAKTDKKTLELIKLVRTQKADIEKAEKPSWKTNRMFSYIEGSSNVVNLAVESNVTKLISYVSFLISQELAYSEAAKRLNVENPPPFTWGGYPLSEWLEDVKLRIAKLQIAAKRAKLEALENRLNTIISPELKAELELEAIQAELGGSS
jgi:hypothetical protein